MNGNTIKYTYNNSGNDMPTIAQIAYNGNSGQGLDYLTTISFEYTSRIDKNFSYIAGKKLMKGTLLKTVTVTESPSGFNRQIEKYSFDYDLDVYTNITQLVEIERTRQGKSLKPTIITYNNTNTSGSAPHQQNAIVTDEQHHYCVGDYNGDGVTDLIIFANGVNSHDYELYTKNPNGGFSLTQSEALQYNTYFSGDTLYPLSQQQHRTGYSFDYNGDGKEDFLYVEEFKVLNGTKRKFYIETSTGNGFEPLDKEILYYPRPSLGNDMFYSTILSNHTPLIGDFDGDGRDELLIIPDKTNSIGSGSPIYSYLVGEKYLTDYTFRNTPSYNSTQLTNLPFYFEGNEARVYVIDYNGDGKSDILFVKNNTSYVYEFNVSFDANDNPVIGTPAFKLVNSTGYPTKWHTTILTGDFNGDGITDLLTWGNNTWEIGYGKGNGLMNDIKPAPYGMESPECGRPVFLSDFNGDGKTDIFDYSSTINTNCQNGYPPRIFYAWGNNYFHEEVNIALPNHISSERTYGYHIGDFNGDGKQDFLSRKTIFSLPYIYYFHPKEHRDLVSKITNGLGVYTKIDYSSIANNGDVYQPGNSGSDYPVVRKTLPLKVVSSIVKSNGIFNTGNTINFHYKGLKFAYWGRGILGFDEIKKHNLATPSMIKKEYTLNNEYFLPFLTSIKNYIGGVLISTKLNTFEVHERGDKVIFPYLKKTITTDEITQENTLTTYDYSIHSGRYGNGQTTGFSIGRPNKIVTLKGFRSYHVVGQGPSMVTNQLSKKIKKVTYPKFLVVPPLPYQARFLPQRVKSTSKRKGEPAYSRTTSFTYNYNKGWLLSSKQDPNTANTVTTHYTYNDFGRKKSESIAAQGLPTKTTKYEYAISTDPRLCLKKYNADYPNFATEYNYNPWTADLLSKIDPDGLETDYTYDAFGRLKSKSNSNGKLKTIEYNWTTLPFTTYSITTNRNTADPVTVYYDCLGRKVRTKRTGFNGETVIKKSQYDIKGQKEWQTLPYFTNSTPQWIHFKHDDFGRPTEAIEPSGATTTYN